MYDSIARGKSTRRSIIGYSENSGLSAGGGDHRRTCLRGESKRIPIDVDR